MWYRNRSGGLAEAVGGGLAGGGRQDDEPYPAYEGHEVDEYPAASLAEVVHAAYRHIQ